MNRYDAEEAIELIDSLLPFAHGWRVELRAKSLGIVPGEKTKKLMMLARLQKEGVIEFTLTHRREQTGYTRSPAIPIYEDVELVEITVIESKYEALKEKYAQHLVIAEYDEMNRTLTLSEEGTIIGTVRFKDSGNNLWIYALTRMEKRLYAENMQQDGIVMRKKSLYAEMSNHRLYSKVLRRITHINDHDKFVIVHRRNFVYEDAFKQMKQALTE